MIDNLKSNFKLNPGAFNARLKEVKYEWKVNNIVTEGRFFYLSFKNGQPNLDDFIDYIYYKVPKFCIPAKEHEIARKKALETEDDRYMMELYDKAKELFIKSKQQQKKAGEPGELILYILLEEAIGAPQVACKMYLKTNKNMPVHGSDGIHLYYDNERDMLRVIWGESKLYNSLSTALDEICESVKSFRESNDETAPIARDIEILKDYISIRDEQLRTGILKYFDPYEEESNNKVDCHACFVGFNYSKLVDEKDIEKIIEDEFRDEYLNRIKSACSLFEEKIKKNKLDKLEFIFFLIPFKDINELRDKFYKKLEGK
ncbi:hypothetical protein NZ45_06415 [Clostridium botulinum]|uniref:DUF1837 domain-containing protein n=1 Tax=Clostridium botulinum TaxID=1491 RepID=A0ABD7CMH2_CLOBO|nr:DUF1837 domain-containing protein [Clostridium botulinum]KGO14528.1 hypothetical protein NZ45_06415 [Clostridium botulinum]QRI54301.1 DUF1837 domain-containing protein [Clostridium botulinum]